MKEALEMLLIDRRNEFRELGASVFPTGSKPITSIKNWEEYLLNFCFDVSEAFFRNLLRIDPRTFPHKRENV